MAYTRWSDCYFYTFWDVDSGSTRETQVLAIYAKRSGSIHPEYSELKDITTAEQAEGLFGQPLPEAPEGDWWALAEVIQCFCEEVREEYPPEQGGRAISMEQALMEEENDV